MSHIIPIFWPLMAAGAISLLCAGRAWLRAWKFERDGSVNGRMERVIDDAEPSIPRMELGAKR